MLKKIKSAFGYTAANKVISKEAEYQLYEKVAKDIKSKEILQELEKRFGLSGLDEKASRKEQ